MLTFVLAGLATADSPEYLLPTDAKLADRLKADPWIETIAREIAPLKHDRGDRLPLIMWHGVGFARLEPAKLKSLAERGFCQHLQLNEAMIPVAKTLQAAGLPVILMEGRTDSWPYSLAEESTDWAHQLDATFPQPWFGNDDAFEWHGACSHVTAGWNVLQRQTRDTLSKFREAGVRVDGIWTDYEGDPYPWSHLYDQTRNCRRCRSTLPPEILSDKARWRAYSWKRYVTLYDQHFAKSVREVFPDCLVTNWHVVRSTTMNPIRYFVRDTLLPPLDFEHFNATNPIAYASDTVWRSRAAPTFHSTQELVDRFFTHELLQQVSTDARNRQGSEVRCVPWVARICKLAPGAEPPAPVMSRGAYREALRHLWLRGVDGMQVFNPMIEGHEEAALWELQDARQIYDEMLAYREMLDQGAVMNFQIPDDRESEVLWSGLRDQRSAIVRVVGPDAAGPTLEVECWPGQRETFSVTPSGKTYRVSRR